MSVTDRVWTALTSMIKLEDKVKAQVQGGAVNFEGPKGKLVVPSITRTVAAKAVPAKAACRSARGANRPRAIAPAATSARRR